MAARARLMDGVRRATAAQASACGFALISALPEQTPEELEAAGYVHCKGTYWVAPNRLAWCRVCG